MSTTEPKPDLMRAFAVSWLELEAARQELSAAEIARRSGIAVSTVTRMFNGESLYGRKDSVGLIADALSVPPLRVYSEALKLWKADPNGRGLEALRDSY